MFPSSRSLATLIFALALLPVVSQHSFAEEKEGSKKVELPKKVEAALKKVSLKGEIESIKKESEDDKVIYEIELEIKGGTVELSYTEDGELVGLEIEPASQKDDDDEEGEDDEHEEREEHGGSEKVKEKSKKAEKHEEDDDEDGEEKEEEDGVEATAVEKMVPFKSLPEAVRKIIAKLSGKNVPEEVETITITLYELENNAEGKEVEWLFDAKGRKIELELDDEDDEHEEHKDEKKEEHHEEKKHEKKD